MGAPHFSSVFLVYLYQKYFSEKISQLFSVFNGIEEHDDKITRAKKLIKYLLNVRITQLTYKKVSGQ